MAKPKASLDDAFDMVQARQEPEATPAPPPTNRLGRPRRTEATRLVGGQLGTRYSKTLNMLSAETGKTNRELLEEALDMLFTAKGAKQIQ
jgi:hypothetical protein